jgi:hypothetical protein
MPHACRAGGSGPIVGPAAAVVNKKPADSGTIERSDASPGRHGAARSKCRLMKATTRRVDSAVSGIGRGWAT